MKTKRKRPVLKWRKNAATGAWESGPFTLALFNEHEHYVANCAGLEGYVRTEHDAKEDCERLAQSILRHCAKGARHGK